ncbi:MAG: hypothetical protein QW812_00500 [Thermoplasmataceae archaeon]
MLSVFVVLVVISAGVGLWQEFRAIPNSEQFPPTLAASVDLEVSPAHPAYVEFSVVPYAIDPVLDLSFNSYVSTPVQAFTPNVTFSQTPEPVNISLISPSGVVWSTGYTDQGYYSPKVLPDGIYDLVFRASGATGISDNVTVDFSALIHYYESKFGESVSGVQKIVPYNYTSFSRQVEYFFSLTSNLTSLEFSLPWFLKVVNISVLVQVPPWLIVKVYLLSDENIPLFVSGNVSTYTQNLTVFGGAPYMLDISIQKNLLNRTNPMIYASIYANGTYQKFWHDNPYFGYFT